MVELTGEVLAVSVGCPGQNSQFPCRPLQCTFIQQLSILIEQSGLWKWSHSAAFYLTGNNTGLLKGHTSVVCWFHGRLIQRQFISLPSGDSVVPHTNCSWTVASNAGFIFSQNHRDLGLLSSSSMASECCRAVKSGCYQMNTFPQHMAIMSLLL